MEVCSDACEDVAGRVWHEDCKGNDTLAANGGAEKSGTGVLVGDPASKAR